MSSYIAWDGNQYQGSPPPGWYQAADNRWWPVGQGPGTAPPPPAPTTPPTSEGTSGAKKIANALWLNRGWKGRVGVGFAGLVLISGLAGSGDTEPEQTADTTTVEADESEDNEITDPTTTSTTTEQPEATSQANAELDTAPVIAQIEPFLVETQTPEAPYERDEYQPGGWGDADNDCINTRHEVLLRDSIEPVVMSADGCFVENGLWVDAYTGQEYTAAADVTIDHHIPLAEGHRSGGWAWSLKTKQAFANDLDDTDALAVVGQSTNQSKADNAPDTWRPENPDSWCGYATAWLDAKTRWELTWRQSELDAVIEMLETCSAEEASTYEVSAFAAPATSTTTGPTTTTIPETAGPAIIEVTQCQRRAEIVTIANTGGEPLSLSGWRLHDEDVNHSTNLNSITLQPGSSIRLLSGPDTVAENDDIKWTSQNVWNNDGDTAFLLDASGTTVSEQRCT